MLTGRAGSLSTICFSPDGKRLASGASDHVIQIWDLSSHRESKLLDRFNAHDSHVFDLSFRNGAEQLASCSSDNSIRIWDTKTRKPNSEISAHADFVRDLDFTSNGNVVASTGNDGSAKLWDVSTETLLRDFDVEVRNPMSVDLSPDGKAIIAAGGDYRGDGPGAIRYWQIDNPEEFQTLYEGTEIVWSASFSPNGMLIAAGVHSVESQLPQIKIWDAQTLEVLKEIDIPDVKSVRCLEWTPDGDHLITSETMNGPSQLRLWNWRSGESTTISNDEKLIPALAISQDGSRVAAGTREGIVKIWQLSANKTQVILESTTHGHSGMIWSVDFTPDGRRLVSAGTDHSARIWNVETGNQLFAFSIHGWLWSASFSPNGRTLALGGDSQEDTAKIHLFHSEDPNQLQ